MNLIRPNCSDLYRAMYFKVSPDIQASGDWEKFTEKNGGYHQKLGLLITQLLKNKDWLLYAVPPAQDVKIKVVEVPSHNISFSDIENHSTKIQHGCLKIIPQRFGNTGTITSIRKHSIFRKSFESCLRNSSCCQWHNNDNDYFSVLFPIRNMCKTCVQYSFCH